jgi:hypothetical protein
MNSQIFLCSRGIATCMAVLALWSAPAAAGTEAIWHCSKHHSISLGPDPFETLSAREEEDLFYLSSFHSEVISISLIDLADIFSGRHVVLGQLPLTGCFVKGESELNRAAFESIGLRWSGLQLMTRRSSIAPNSLRMVPNEDEMRACIVNNFPAVGYLSRVIEDEEVAPCF